MLSEEIFAGEAHLKKSIRKYSSRDRDAVRRICWLTGYGGNSVAPFFDDPALFADLWFSYYPDREPHPLFIAEADGKVVVFLLGCLDTVHYTRVFTRRIVPSILVRAITGRYRIRRNTLRYFHALLGQMFRHEFKTPPLKRYPAHLHINIAEGYRRGGLGQGLMESYFAYLRGYGIRGLHLGTSSLHTSALPFYEKLGFKVYAAVDSMFLGQPVTNICYVKEL